MLACPEPYTVLHKAEAIFDWVYTIDQFDLTGEEVKKHIHFINRKFKVSNKGDKNSFLRTQV